MTIETTNENAIVEAIVTNIVRNDEEAAYRFARAKRFKVNEIVVRRLADTEEDFKHADLKRKAYRRNMRKCMERIVGLTGIPEEYVKAALVWYATEVVTDALIDEGC